MRSFSTSNGGQQISNALTVLDHDPEQEGLVQVEDQEQPDETNTILLVEWLNLPVKISEGVLEEASNILECSPLLGHIARLSSGSDKLCKVAISLLGKSSIYQIN